MYGFALWIKITLIALGLRESQLKLIRPKNASCLFLESSFSLDSKHGVVHGVWCLHIKQGWIHGYRSRVRVGRVGANSRIGQEQYCRRRLRSLRRRTDRPSTRLKKWFTVIVGVGRNCILWCRHGIGPWMLNNWITQACSISSQYWIHIQYDFFEMQHKKPI